MGGEMESVHGAGLTAEQSQLLGVVRGVRNRYRLKRGLRGAAIAVAITFAVFVAMSYVMNAFKYNDASVLWGRITTIAAFVAAVFWFVVRPLLPKFRDEQVALYLEEHEHSLRASVITAVEMQNGGGPVAPALRSQAMLSRLTHSALERVHKSGDGKAIDAGELKTNGTIFAAVMAGAILFTVFGPDALRRGFNLVSVPWAAATPASIFSIAVDPGNVTIAKGGDELIEAHLRGFSSDRVELLVRHPDSTS